VSIQDDNDELDAAPLRIVVVALVLVGLVVILVLAGCAHRPPVTAHAHEIALERVCREDCIDRCYDGQPERLDPIGFDQCCAACMERCEEGRK